MVLAGIAVFGHPGLLAAGPGDLDPQFNVEGQKIAFATALQPDGKLLVGYNSYSLGLGESGIVRLHPDGRVDGGFTPMVRNGSVNCILVQPDGKILAGGSFHMMIDGEWRKGLIRLLADGTLDSSFQAYSEGSTLSLALQDDGKILAGGGMRIYDGNILARSTLVRLNPDGTLDMGFDAGAFLGSQSTAVTSIAVQPDGRILAGGTFDSIRGILRKSVARFYPDGELDDSFNPDVTSGQANSGVCLKLNSDGKILVGGDFYSGVGVPKRGLERLLADGKLDPGFKPDIPALQVSSIAESSDGKILVGINSAKIGQEPSNNLFRLNADGSRDAAFVFKAVSPPYHVSSLSLQSDGKPLVLGYKVNEPGKLQQFLFRLENEPAVSKLSAPAFNRVRWLRSGSSPEALAVGFDFSTDGGLLWNSLGQGSRINGGWELTGPGLPDGGLLRARAAVGGGASTGLVEKIEPFSALAVPDAAVTGNNREIASGDLAPEGADHSDFGQVDAVNGTLVRTFAILNRGSVPLALQGTPAIQVGGRDVLDFTVISQPLLTVAPGSGTSFMISFNPRALGLRTAVITILSDDADERIYEFAIQGSGTGVAPEVAVQGNSVEIAAGDANPSLEDHTDFGRAGTVGGITVRSFTILNSGTGDLMLTDQPAISITGPNAADFTVSLPPPGVVPPGATTEFQVAFAPADPGLRHAVIHISNNDEDEGEFHFAIQGAGRFPGEVQAEFPSLKGADIRTMAVQGDGKILFGVSWGLIRREADGTVDPGFKTSFPGAVTGAVVQPDGNIMLTGSFTWINDLPAPGVARLLADGKLDRTFQSAVSGTVKCMAVQPDGKILVGGNLQMAGVARSLVRLDTDGKPDPAFNSDHVINGLTCMTLMEDGKVMIGGTFTAVGGMAKKYIARLLPDGNPDPEFDAAPDGLNVLCMAPQGDGKLIITGAFSHVNGIPCNGIARLLEDGSVDGEYQGNLGGAGSMVRSLALQTDGGLVLGGTFTELNGVPRMNIARLAGDGTMDAGFHSVSNMTADLVVVQADGRILLGGRFGVNRLENTPSGSRLTVSGYNRMSWMRSGTAPEASAVIFEASLDNGVTWRILGRGSRISGGWELNGPGLPAAGLLRASAWTVSSLDGGSNGIAAETMAFDSLVTPRMSLAGNGVEIQNGDTTPTATDHSDFGPAAVRGGLAGSVFTIHNTGSVPLNLFGNSPVTLAGPNAGEFRVAALSSSTVAAGGSLTFEVYFDPAALGLRTAVVHIASDDFSGSDYTFAVQGTGSGPAPEISASGNEIEIPGGDNPPSAVDHTDFGSTRSADDTVTRTFTVLNQGTTELILGGVRFSGPTAGDFSVIAPPMERVPANGQAPFQIIFDPTGTGSRRAVVEVSSDDDDESVFRFVIQGTGWAQGDLDLDFRTYPNHLVSSLGLQSDSSILIGGRFTYVGKWAGTSPDSLRSFSTGGFARLGNDGSLYPAQKLISGGANFVVSAIARQPDGKLLAGGYITSDATPGHLMRLNEDNSQDNTFNAVLNGYCRSLALMPDGKIVIGGQFTTVGGSARAGLARLNADGTLDTGFDPKTTGIVRCVLRQPDGKVLFAGVFSNVGGVGRNQIARLNADGSLDADFDPRINGEMRCMALQADGKIIVGGDFFRVGIVNRSRIARLNPDGTLDMDFNPAANEDVLSMAVQTDGKIVVAGEFTKIGAVNRNRLARLNADGTLDADFDPGANDVVRGVLIDSRGRIILGGPFTSVDGVERFRLARLDNGPAPQVLQTTGGSQIRWLRGGASAETNEVSFELSTDGADTWTPLGKAVRIEGGWGLADLNLPSAGKIRARARIQGGYHNSSGSLVETVAEIGSQDIPQITVELHPGSVLKNGAGELDFGVVHVGNWNQTRRFTIINRGILSLNITDISIEGANIGDFTLTAPKATAFLLPGLSSAVIEVLFHPISGGDREARVRISSNGGGLPNPYYVSLSGKGNTRPRFSGYVLQARKDTRVTLNSDVIKGRILDPEGDETTFGNFWGGLLGGSVLQDDGGITYDPPTGHTGLDLIQFDIRDSHGLTERALITVRVGDDGGPPSLNTLETARFAYGPTGFLFQGVSGQTYQIQRSTDLESWITIETQVAGEGGAVPFMDQSPPLNKIFYRVVTP